MLSNESRNILNKLEQYGIRGISHGKWFSFYLSGRIQTTHQVGFNISKPEQALCDVLKGSVYLLTTLIWFTQLANCN